MFEKGVWPAVFAMEENETEKIVITVILAILALS